MNLRNILFALLFVVVGVGLVAFGWTEYQNQQSDLEEAVQIEGTIESTEIDEERTDSGSTEGVNYNYEAIVRYTYSYEEQQYTSESLYPGPDGSFNSRGKAEDIISQYSSGQETTVYVNQEDPSRAFLIERTRTFRVFGIMLGGVVFILSGIVFFLSKRGDEDSPEE
jgi:hypothetical protein